MPSEASRRSGTGEHMADNERLMPNPLPPELTDGANAPVLAFLHGRSAHSDIALPLLAAVQGLPGVGVHCSDRERFGFVVAWAEGRVFAFAEGMQGVTLRLPVPVAAAMLSRGAQPRPELGPGWIFLGLHGAGGFEGQLPALAGTAFAEATAAASTADREFVHARLIDAPPERVFRAFSDPAQLCRWWGPNGFSSSFQDFELRPGGAWRFMMHGPDGSDHANESVFLEVEAPRRVVFDHLSGHHFRMSLGLEAQGGQTLVRWRQVFDSAAERQRIAAFVTEANEQNLDRLQAVVREMA